jgi:hypothetical protein
MQYLGYTYSKNYYFPDIHIYVAVLYFIWQHYARQLARAGTGSSLLN